MNFTKKTYYGLGVVSAVLNALGGAALLIGSRFSLLFNLATVAAGAMMLLLAMSAESARQRNFCLAGVLLTILGMTPGIIGIVCGAAAWPVFAWPYFQAEASDSLIRKAASVVFVCGGALLIGSFLPIPRMLGGCIICAVAAAQGLFAALLYQQAARGSAP